MGQATDQIETHIDKTREALKSNLEELESRARAVTSWRSHFEKRPGLMLVGALMGGALLSSMLGRHPGSRDD